MTPSHAASAAAIRLREWAVIISLAVLSVAYLPIVIHRTAVSGFGDVLVFFRAGWAITTGYPLYAVTDNHRWSYHYPPSFALALAPFANPLPDHPQPAWALRISSAAAPTSSAARKASGS